MDFITAPYIDTHNHPYIRRFQQVRLVATYVGMVMYDNVGCYNEIHTCLCTLLTIAIPTSSILHKLLAYNLMFIHYHIAKMTFNEDRAST